jgi:hypothetical protein
MKIIYNHNKDLSKTTTTESESATTTNKKRGRPIIKK